MANEAKERLRALNSVIELLSFMRRRIISARAPLHDIFSQAEDKFLEKCGMLPLLQGHRHITYELWEEAIGLVPLDEYCRKEILYLGKDMGVLPLDDQEKRISACIEALSARRDMIKSRLPEKQKTAKTLSLLSGLLAVILLL